jgi:hypothetical protein
VSISSLALPVYEIYKVGEELHWKAGLDFFSPYGLSLVFIPHWNNQDGGLGLDTSRCYMGESRFSELIKLLPEDQILIGIDENTGMVIDFQAGYYHVVGQGNVTIINQDSQRAIPAGNKVNLSDLGNFQLCDPLASIKESTWESALKADTRRSASNSPPLQVIDLAEKRIKARADKKWEEADQLRQDIESQGWIVQDTADGYHLEKTNT